MKLLIRPYIFLLATFLLARCGPDERRPPAIPQNLEDRSTEVEVNVGTSDNPRPPQNVSSPPLPDVVTFAGDTVPLHRDNVREDLENELIVNTFRHSRTLSIIKTIDRWRPLIEETLKEHQVPVDFIYLAVAESEFDNNARSFAGAMGMWQFMEGTARQFDLQIDRYVDMRRDPELATEAACQYLLQAYARFNDWTLAAAAYNRGIRAIEENLEDQQVDNFYDLHLNPETARYVYRIIAFKLILENPEAYGYFIKPEDRYAPYAYTTEIIEDDIDNLAEYARERGTTYKELRILNPWFNNTSNYKLNVPRNTTYTMRIPLSAETENNESGQTDNISPE